MLRELNEKQLNHDEAIERYKALLETDVLTGLHNRYAYVEDLNRLEDVGAFPDNLVVFSVDINELKKVNDTFGHLAGDELIRGASDCIKKVLGSFGRCYRTGGDEFIAVVYMDVAAAYAAKKQLLAEVDAWHGERVYTLSLSVGYAVAADYDDISLIEKLISIADEKMYESKAQFYMQSGKNRRKNENKHSEAIEQKHKEYIDIISALASDVTGLYVIDRIKHEVTAYRLSASDHRIRSGVPLKLGFETAMNQFIAKKVHPDDREVMSQSIRQDFIERELTGKKSFLVHFRTLIDGEINYNYMKCIRNTDDEAYDKIVISFCPEDTLMSKRRVQEAMRVKEDGRTSTVLIVTEPGALTESLERRLEEWYYCLTAHTGADAIDILKKRYTEISVVFYQEDLPGLSAKQFLQEIKEDIFVSFVPAVVVATEENEAELEACVDLGAVDFIRKPFSRSILYQRVSNIVRMRALFASLDEIEIDDLTGLYTKQAFYYHARTLIDEYPQEDFTMIIVDILNFKLFNSVYGMAQGDELLVSLSKLIRGMLVNGICARYGADQFIAILKTPKKNILAYMELLQKQLSDRGMESVTLKFGVYDHVDHNLDIARMCDRALQALQSIKTNYGRRYARFDGPVSQSQLQAQLYEARFHKAMERQQFVVWYQPKYNPYTEKIVGAEALVRWQTEDGRMISPAEFLPVFESDGLIAQLDEYVFRIVCAQQRKWKLLNKPLLPISVNLSRNSMHRPEIVKRYKAIVDAYGITSDVVPIEITESAATGTSEIKPLADAFYEEGFSLHMDDFGSGNSSIAGLNMLHFDTVKLDRSLIEYIGNEDGNLVLMYTVALGKELGLHLVAEGVETIEQVEYLKDIGCETIQGYYYCRPLPVDEFEKQVTENIDLFEAKYDYRYKLTAADSVVKRAMDRMLQRMPGGFFTYRGDDGRILSSNSYLWNMFGCASEEEFMAYVGGNFRGLVLPEDYELVQQYITTQIKDDDNEMDYVEYRIRRKDGTIVSVADYGHLDHQADGDVFYVFIREST